MARDRQQDDQHAPQAARYRLRVPLVGPLLLIALALVGLRVLGQACSFDAVLDFLNVHDRERFSQLTVFAAGLLGLLAIVKVLVSNIGR
jgi:hypothetical protein